jgi:putative transposase
MYRTYQIRIKNGHRLYAYCDEFCFKAKNLYNTTNFFIRQIFTAFNSENIHPLQKEIVDLIDLHLPRMNQIKMEYVAKRREKELKKPLERQKEIKDATLFAKPSKKKNLITYRFLDALFKTSKQNDYMELPGQVNQQVMRVVFQNWKSFFSSLKDYKKNSIKYKGKPNLPKYVPKNGRKECTFSNQVCVIKDDKYLKFPLTKERLNIGKLGVTGKLQQVRIIPNYGEYTIELVMDVKQSEENHHLNSDYVMGIDLGVNCLATMVDNTGLRPVIIKGKTVKSINQYYNKRRSFLVSALRSGKSSKEGTHTSKRLNRLDRIRFSKVKDYFHKTSFHIVKTAFERKVSKIIIGKNKDWKENVEMRKSDKQNFKFLPYSLLIKMVTYKAERLGIEVIEQEESYTSQASLIDMDLLPTFNQGEKIKKNFSGKRITRGQYLTKEKTILHADVNAGGNIVRKVVPDAFAKGIEGIVSCPLMLSIK